MTSVAKTKEIGMDNIQMTAWARGYVEGQEVLINELFNLIDTMSKDELSALLRRYPVAYSTADGQVFQNSCTKIKQDR